MNINVQAPEFTTTGTGETKIIAAMRIDAPVSVRRAVLIEMDSQCREKLAADGIDLTGEDYTFLALSLATPDCQCSVKYKGPSDVPLDDVLCEHGNYLLLWTDSQVRDG